METSKKMGRPKLDDPKSRNIQTRFTESEYADIQKCAKKNNQTITQFVRQGILKAVESQK